MNAKYERYLEILSAIVIIIFLIIVVIIAIRIVFVNDIPKVIEDLDPSTLNTGDIVGVGYNNIFGGFVTAWFASIWSHCGIIYKSPKTSRCFVLEAAMYGGKYNGVIKIPLETWIHYNKRSYIGVSRLAGNKLDPIILMREFNKLKKFVQLDSYNYRWWRLLFTTPYRVEKERTKYTCYELLITLLQNCKVVKKKHSCSSYNPKMIMVGNLPMVGDYRYKKVVRLDIESYKTVIDTFQE